MIVAGKGGVGKTTVSATLALMAARAGLRTTIVEVEGKSGLPALFEQPDTLNYRASVLLPADDTVGRAVVAARTLTSDDALLEYLEDHGMRRISKRLTSTGTLEVIATAIPGIKDILVLGKVKQLEQAAAAGEPGAPDLIIIDAPAAGHAVTFLASAHGLRDAVNVGPIGSQSTDVIEFLGDPKRCQVMLVTLPEETPVNEAVETAFHLEDRAGVQLAPIVVNGLYPVLDLPDDPAAAAQAAGLGAGDVEALVAAADFRRRRQDLQAEQCRRLAEQLPLQQIPLPLQFTTELCLGELDTLADAMTRGVASLDPLPVA
jgi:anion-transporting  ArsA/GET3 family ATPase